MDIDDGIRARKGVVACLRFLKSGKVRLILDDVSTDNEVNPKKWKHDIFYTWNEYDLEKLKDLKLPEKEMAKIGENLILRLLAINKEI